MTNPVSTNPASTDELAFLDGTATTEPTHTGAKGRTCRRHHYCASLGSGVVACCGCFKPRDEDKARQGKRNRRHGNDMERQVAAALGGSRVGQFGTLVDVETPLYVIQVKAGGRFPGWIADILAGMPESATRRRVLACFDSPGPGRKRRGIVVELWDDWAQEHGRGEK